MLQRSSFTGVTDVHCITKGRTFHLQKKKVHNKSSSFPPTIRWHRLLECESPRKMRFPRGAMQRGVSPRFQNSKGAPRRSTSGERSWIVSTEDQSEKSDKENQFVLNVENLNCNPWHLGDKLLFALYGCLCYCHTQKKTFLPTFSANIPMLVLMHHLSLIIFSYLTVPECKHVYFLWLMLLQFSLTSVLYITSI